MAKVTGAEKVIARINLECKRTLDRTGQGLMDAAQFLLEKSQEIVPIDYKKLHDSGRVVVSGKGYNFMKVSVQYGGHDVPYAVIVHENPDAMHGQAFNIVHAAQIAKHPATGPYRHPRRPQELYKFLETPMRQYHGKMMQIVANGAKKP